MRSFQPFVIFLIAGMLCVYVCEAQVQIPSYYKQSKKFNEELRNIVHDVGLDSSYDAGDDGQETISFVVIDLNGKKPLLGGVNINNFIYPASVYKMYVAMEVLKQVNNGEYSLYQSYIVKSPNDVDRSKEIEYDPRPPNQKQRYCNHKLSAGPYDHQE